MAFVHEGLSRGARCLFLGTNEDYETLGRGLEELGICTRRATSRGALQFRVSSRRSTSSTANSIRRARSTRPDALIDEALADGFTGLRHSAELTNVPDQESWRQIVWYEAMINERFARRPIATLCRYARTRCRRTRPRPVAHAPDRDRPRRNLREPVLRAPRDRADAATCSRSSTGSSGSCAFSTGHASTSRAPARRRWLRRPSWPASCTTCGPAASARPSRTN